MKEEITYAELARRVGDCILNNEVMNNENFHEWERENGEDIYCYKHDPREDCEAHNEDCDYESVEVYQNYIITEGGADYLKRNTNEIVYYNDKLNMYIWGITHFGTSWDGVHTTIGSKEEEL